MSIEKLRFPSGKSVKKIKQEVKKIKHKYKNNTEALCFLAKQNGVDLPWDKAISYLKNYWNAWFAIGIYQEDAHWSLDVILGRFETEEEATKFAKLSNQVPVWNGGETPLLLVDGDGNHKVLNNADVRLWRTKKESMNKICISAHDLERVYAPIKCWQETFEKQTPQFSSLAYATEFGDHNSVLAPPSKDSEKHGTGDSHLDKVGIKLHSEQLSKNIYQITHSMSRSKVYYYILSDRSRSEISSVIGLLSYLIEELNYLPSYYSGSVALSEEFISGILRCCFDCKEITSSSFNYRAENPSDESITVVDIFDVEDFFDSNDYDFDNYEDVIEENKERVLALYRKSLGLPEKFNESKWKVVNINRLASETSELPLEVNNLSIVEAWDIKEKLEDLTMGFVAEQNDLLLDSNYGTIYEILMSADDSGVFNNSYPIYKVKHADFLFN